MTTKYEHAAHVLGQARTHWGSGPDAGPTVALVGVGLALLAIHDLLEERLGTPAERLIWSAANTDAERGIEEH